jgi:hypothetical protein
LLQVTYFVFNRELLSFYLFLNFVAHVLIVSKVVVPRGCAITLFSFIVLRLSADKQDERLICQENSFETATRIANYSILYLVCPNFLLNGLLQRQNFIYRAIS